MEAWWGSIFLQWSSFDVPIYIIVHVHRSGSGNYTCIHLHIYIELFIVWGTPSNSMMRALLL